MNSADDKPRDLSVAIADDIRTAIVAGELAVDQRLPSEAELAEHFEVSRPTVREALKRLAAQSLIRTQRGASGGAFVNKLKFEEAYEAQVTTVSLLTTMNQISFDAACEARFALERACLGMAARRREDSHLARMRHEIDMQTDKTLTDEDFCASDVRFHRAVVDAAGNPLLGFQLSSAIEGIMPWLNMITFNAQSRVDIVAFHHRLTEALDEKDAGAAAQHLNGLETYTRSRLQQSRS
jgi:DNA-binding FadR family transcriptional regulator